MRTSNKIISAPNYEVLDDVIFSYIKKDLGNLQKTKAGIEKIYEWKEKNFINDKEGKIQRKIGEITVQELFAGEKFPKLIKGCHQHALVLKAILEKYGFPVKIIETIDKNGAYYENKKVFKGHVVLGVFVQGNREILDTTCDSRDGCFLSQDAATDIIDGKRFPFAEGNTLAEIGIVDKESWNKIKAVAQKNLKKDLIKKRIHYVIKKLADTLNMG